MNVLMCIDATQSSLIPRTFATIQFLIAYILQNASLSSFLHAASNQKTGSRNDLQEQH